MEPPSTLLGTVLHLPLVPFNRPLWFWLPGLVIFTLIGFMLPGWGRWIAGGILVLGLPAIYFTGGVMIILVLPLLVLVIEGLILGKIFLKIKGRSV